MTEDEIKTLFGANATSGTCKVYVIANRPDGVDLPATTSISALKQLAVTAAFIDNKDNGSAVQTTAGSIPGRQANFVMDSNATDVVTLATDETNKKSLSGTVPLYRPAAKIGLFVNVEHEITDANGVTWTSDPTDMKMTFHNGVMDGYIGNDLYTYTVDYRTDDNNTVYNLFSIEGNADFKNSNVRFLGDLRMIEGNADFENSYLTSLNKLEKIGGNARFNNSKISDLGALKHIGGYANFANSRVDDFKNLEYIGGEIIDKNGKYVSNPTIDVISGLINKIEKFFSSFKNKN